MAKKAAPYSLAVPGHQLIYFCLCGFVYSSVHGHLGCFHYLIIMNNAAVNICAPFWCGHIFSVLLGIY